MKGEDAVDPDRSVEERVAAFLDGTLEPGERRAFLEDAGADPNLLALLVDSADTLREVDPGTRSAAGASTPPPASGAPRTWRRWPLAGLAIAAALSALLFLPFGDDDPAAALLALASDIPVAALPDGPATLAAAPWRATRGAADPDDDRLVRAGMRLADLQAAAAAGAAEAAAVTARDAAAILGGAVGAGPVTAALRTAADAAEATEDGWSERAEEALDAAVRVFDGPDLRRGLWMETVRMAALASDGGTLGSPSLLDAGRTVADESPDPAAAGVRAVLVLLEATGAPDPAAVLRSLDDSAPLR